MEASIKLLPSSPNNRLNLTTENKEKNIFLIRKIGNNLWIVVINRNTLFLSNLAIRINHKCKGGSPNFNKKHSGSNSFKNTIPNKERIRKYLWIIKYLRDNIIGSSITNTHERTSKEKTIMNKWLPPLNRINLIK